MKQTKYNLILGLVLVGLLLVIAWPIIIKQLDALGFSLGTSSQPQLNFPEVITQVSIERDENQILLSASDSGWVVNNYPADEEIVSELLSSLDRAQIESVASRNADNFAEYGIEAETTKLVLNQDSGQAYRLGDRGQALNTSYLKPENQDVVYTLNVDLTDFKLTSTEWWRDKTLAKVDETQIETVTLSHNGRQLTLTPEAEETSWQASLGDQTRTVGDSVIDQFLELLTDFKAGRFADESETADFQNLQKSELTIELTQDESVEFQLVHDQNDSSTWFISSNSYSDPEAVLVISNIQANQLVENFYSLFN